MAVDDSETSEAALQEAIRLAAQAVAPALLLVSVVEVPAAALTAEGANEVAVERNELKSARRVLAAAVDAVRAAGLNAQSATPEALGTSVGDAIVTEAQRWNADVIVIGTHGRRGFRRLVLGSVAESVARAADRPVLLVRHPGARTAK